MLKRLKFLLSVAVICLISAGTPLYGWTFQDTVPESMADELNVSVEFRHRYEMRDNFDFNDAVDDHDGFHLFRTRVNVDWTPGNVFRACLQIQDARLWESDFVVQTAFEDDVDIRQAFVEFRDLADGHLSFRMGRQELSYGEQRFIGGFNWSNVARTFDALKGVFKVKDSSLEVFAARVVVIESDEPNEWNDNEELYGIYATCNALEKHTLESYFYYRDLDIPIMTAGVRTGYTEVDESMLGFRFHGKELNGFDYNVEYIRQFGNRGSMGIDAYGAIAGAGYTFEATWKPRLFLEWNKGSGGMDVSGNEWNNLDNLYPTNHMYYGYMDRTGLTNLRDIHARFSVKPTKKLYLHFDVHDLKFNDVTTGVRDDLGMEYDLLVKYKYNKYFKFLAGYSQFEAGDFLKDTGSGDDGDYFYFQTTITL